MAIYLGPNKVTLQGYITDEQESSGAVKFLDYDGTILHEYSKDEFLALSSMPENPTSIRPLSGAIITDPGQDYFDGITDSEGKIYYDPVSLDRWADYPNIVVNGETLYPTANTQTDNIVSDFLQDMYDNAGLEGTYHNETDVFVINGNSYKLITEATTTTGYLQILKQENLVSQGWNWSLSDAQAYVQESGYLNIGQTYITTSGDTEIDIEFPQGSVRLSPYLGIGVNGEVDIDWGDNSTHSTVTGTGLTSQIRTQHTYSQPGKYTIKIHVNLGNFAFYSTNIYPLLNANGTSSYSNRVYSSKVKNIRIGRNCFINSSYAFSYCTSLQSITIPNTVTSIGSYAFYTCYSLQSITLPNTVTSISDNAFYNCYSLQSITVPNTIISIRDNAFYRCHSLQSITLPNTVTLIGSDVFYGCYSIKVKTLKYLTYINYFNEVSIKNSVTSIKSSAFQSCYSLQSITIPNTVTSISDRAFYNCFSLQSVTLPNTVTSMGGYVFYGCYSLQSITLPNTVTSIGSYAFFNCYSLQSITIPNTVTSIGSQSFNSCYSLQSITLSNSVTTIYSSAFSGCYSLQSITLPNTVTSISDNAFYNCCSLQSITIPNTVTSIGDSAFSGCYGMKEYHLKSTTPPTLGSNVFSNIPSDCIIYVPQGSLSSYQTATNWSTYANYMQEETN